MTRRVTHKDGPDPIDVHVGRRMNERRRMLMISQDKLGQMTGITFQQVQKYSTGKNRMSASRLYITAKALGVDVQYFFEGLAGHNSAPIDPVFVSKPAMEAARLVYGMDALGAQFLIQMLRRLVPTAATED